MRKKRGNLHEIEALQPNSETRNSSFKGLQLLLISLLIACFLVGTIAFCFVANLSNDVANKTNVSRKSRALGAGASAASNLNAGQLNNTVVLQSSRRNQPDAQGSSLSSDPSEARVLHDTRGRTRLLQVDRDPSAGRVLLRTKSTRNNGPNATYALTVEGCPASIIQLYYDPNRASHGVRLPVDSDENSDRPGTSRNALGGQVEPKEQTFEWTDAKILEETIKFFARRDFTSKTIDEQFQEVLMISCFAEEGRSELPNSTFKTHWKKVYERAKELKETLLSAEMYKQYLICLWLNHQKSRDPNFDMDHYKAQIQAPYTSVRVIRLMTDYLSSHKFRDVNVQAQLLLLQNIDYNLAASEQPQEFRDFIYRLTPYLQTYHQRRQKEIKRHLIRHFLDLHKNSDFPDKFDLEAQKRKVREWLNGRTREEVEAFDVSKRGHPADNALMTLRWEFEDLNVNWGKAMKYDQPAFKSFVLSVMNEDDTRPTLFKFLEYEIEDFLGSFEIDVVMQWSCETPEYELFLKNARRIAYAHGINTGDVSVKQKALDRLKRIRKEMFFKETGKPYFQVPQVPIGTWNEKGDEICQRYIDEGMTMLKSNTRRLTMEIRTALKNPSLSSTVILYRLTRLQKIEDLWKSEEVVNLFNAYIQQTSSDVFSQSVVPKTASFEDLCEQIFKLADERMTVRPSRQEIHSKTIAFKANHDRSFTNYKAIDLKLYDFVEEKLEWTDDEWAAVSLLEFTKEMNEILKVENPSQRWVTTWQLRQRMNYMRRALQVLSKNPHFKGTNRGLEDLLRFSSEEDHWSVIFRTVEYPGLLYQYIFNQFNTLALSNSLVAVKETGKYLTSDAEMKDRVEKYLEFSQEYLGENSIISISGVYLLLDATSPIDSFNDFVTSIFYIGCGIPTRPVTHIRYATSESTSANKSPTGLKIKEIWNSGNKVVVFQPYDELTKREALIIEESLISTVGFSQLVNSMLGVKVPPANEFSNEIRQAYGANKLLQAYKLYQQSEPILITREIAQKSTNARKSLITKPKP